MARNLIDQTGVLPLMLMSRSKSCIKAWLIIARATPPPKPFKEILLMNAFQIHPTDGVEELHALCVDMARAQHAVAVLGMIAAQELFALKERALARVASPEPA